MIKETVKITKSFGEELNAIKDDAISSEKKSLSEYCLSDLKLKCLEQARSGHSHLELTRKFTSELDKHNITDVLNFIKSQCDLMKFKTFNITYEKLYSVGSHCFNISATW